MRAAAHLAWILPLALWASPQAFDAASVKPSAPDHFGAQIYSPGPGRFRTLTATVKDMVAFAYSVPVFRVSGGPGWTATEAYDIEAKAAGPASNAEFKTMLQALLADRFQLALHRESKESSVYNLVVAKSGPKLAKAEKGLGVGMGKGRLNGRGADMATLASVLSRNLERTVIDRTGIGGYYDFKLTWTPDEAAATEPAISIFAALQDQLGLKLESARGPVEMIVIDRVERPTEN